MSLRLFCQRARVLFSAALRARTELAIFVAIRFSVQITQAHFYSLLVNDYYVFPARTPRGSSCSFMPHETHFHFCTNAPELNIVYKPARTTLLPNAVLEREVEPVSFGTVLDVSA
jgi:hypothetical protein